MRTKCKIYSKTWKGGSLVSCMTTQERIDHFSAMIRFWSSVLENAPSWTRHAKRCVSGYTNLRDRELQS